jgi:hypothetical protein
LQFIYTYYVQSPKQTLERRKLVMFMEHKAQKNFKIYNLVDFYVFTYKADFGEYKNSVVHIFDEHAFNATTKANLELLCDIDICMCFTCVKYHFVNTCRTFSSLDESILMMNHFCSKKMMYNKYYSTQ